MFQVCTAFGNDKIVYCWYGWQEVKISNNGVDKVLSPLFHWINPSNITTHPTSSMHFYTEAGSSRRLQNTENHPHDKIRIQKLWCLTTTIWNEPGSSGTNSELMSRATKRRAALFKYAGRHTLNGPNNTSSGCEWRRWRPHSCKYTE
jgi:hypothetical protein